MGYGLNRDQLVKAASYSRRAAYASYIERQAVALRNQARAYDDLEIAPKSVTTNWLRRSAVLMQTAASVRYSRAFFAELQYRARCMIESAEAFDQMQSMSVAYGIPIEQLLA